LHLNGRKVAQLRLEKGWSQQQLAVKAGLHAMTVSEIERQGRGTKEPRLATVEALAQALNVERAELLTDVEPEPAEAAS
jgi:transcriptional regulator with XRE-family HTH domain